MKTTPPSATDSTLLVHAPARRVQQRRAALVVHGARVQRGQPEVRDLEVRVHVQQQVLGLEVAVAHTCGPIGGAGGAYAGMIAVAQGLRQSPTT